jgi:hypothetical protein
MIWGNKIDCIALKYSYLYNDRNCGGIMSDILMRSLFVVPELSSFSIAATNFPIFLKIDSMLEFYELLREVD